MTRRDGVIYMLSDDSSSSWKLGSWVGAVTLPLLFIFMALYENFTKFHWVDRVWFSPSFGLVPTRTLVFVGRMKASQFGTVALDDAHSINVCNIRGSGNRQAILQLLTSLRRREDLDKAYATADSPLLMSTLSAWIQLSCAAMHHKAEYPLRLPCFHGERVACIRTAPGLAAATIG